MTNNKSGYIQVPGARISYRIHGSGPFLLLIAGGEGSGDGYDHLAGILSDRYTVVTYDRRGAPGSPPDNLDEDVRLETHSDEAGYISHPRAFAARLDEVLKGN
jgi:pimeloyl-ACP methyl ester carboxylesterase